MVSSLTAPAAAPASASTTFGAGSGVLGLTFGSFQGGDLGALLSGPEKLDGQAGSMLGARLTQSEEDEDIPDKENSVRRQERSLV
ncbi:hypothetical protein BGZ99_007864 [Dissophora globulifera]|uniref:Uncharacterized protein n=1 Tax=Dissophora globulifera TaxID=979702 RepID=A0A9P6UP40_9FUNG|nr:hypothetical protein BGZ99_007864 [Dissophora globulifera]